MMTNNASDPNLPSLRQLTIERSQLLEKLDAAVRYRLTLIAAPPGYGKTTLVAQFAHRAPVPVAWHTVEKREYDLPNLIEHAISSLAAVVPAIAEVKLPPGAPAGELATVLTDHLREALTDDLIYILDDVHHLMDAPAAESWLRAFVETLPANCHLVLIGRALPPLPVAEMIARREVLALGQDQLRFNFEEVVTLAENTGTVFTVPEIQKLFARLDGWPAGVLLALQPLPTYLDTSLFNNKWGPEGLFDALAEVMLRAQPPLLQEFLLRSSTLAKMTPTLCQTALQISNSLDHLNDTLQRNVFAVQVPGGITYHPLFRDFLQRQLKQRNPALFAQLHAAAGKWFEGENRLDEAFDHYATAEHWDEAAAIAARSVQMVFAKGQVETVLAWKGQLDGAGIHVPRLSFYSGMLYRDRYEYDLADAAFKQAEQGYRAEGNQTGLIQIELMKATVDTQRGNYALAINRAEPFTTDPATPSNLRGFAYAIIGTARYYLGELEEAITQLTTALPLWRATGDTYAVAGLLVTMENVYVLLGRFDDAARCLDEFVELRRAFGSNVGLAMALNNLGYFHYLLGDYAQASETFEEGLKVVGRVPESQAEAYLRSSVGDLQRDRGAFAEAEAHYRKALDLTINSEPTVRSTVLISLATLRRWQGRLDEAKTFALDAASVADKHHLSLEKLDAEIAACAILIEQGNLTAAQKELGRLLTVVQKRPSPFPLVKTLGMCAYAALLAGEAGESRGYLGMAMKAATHPAILRPLITELAHFPALKTLVQSNPNRFKPLIDGLAQLEDAQSNVPEPEKKTAKSPASVTYSLRVWALGQETVERDGKLVPPSVWQAASARELFVYLLFRGPSSREQIGLDFWPDSSPTQVRQKFHATLHRVRDAVGTNAIVFEDDLYSINPNIDLWCDVFEFEAAARQAQLTSPLLNHAEVLWRRAVELYRGDLLPTYHADWVLTYRETLVQLCLDALLALGNRVYGRGDVHNAVGIFKRAVDIDPYREDIHRALLTCYAGSGQRGLVIRHTEKLTSMLESELGIPPSLETLTLVENLLS